MDNPLAPPERRARYEGGLDRGFKAKWPSARATARHYRWVAIDFALIAYSYFIARYVVSSPSSFLGGLGRLLFSPLILLPWLVRVLHRTLHSALSLPVLPSPVIYYRGAFVEWIPEFVRRMQVVDRPVRSEGAKMHRARRTCSPEPRACTVTACKVEGIMSGRGRNNARATNAASTFCGTPMACRSRSSRQTALGFPAFILRARTRGRGLVEWMGPPSYGAISLHRPQARCRFRSDGDCPSRFPGNGEAWELFDPGSVRDYVDHGINVGKQQVRCDMQRRGGPVTSSALLCSGRLACVAVCSLVQLPRGQPIQVAAYFGTRLAGRTRRALHDVGTRRVCVRLRDDDTVCAARAGRQKPPHPPPRSQHWRRL